MEQFRPADCESSTFDQHDVSCGQIVYKNFAIKSAQTFIGIAVQKQKLYVVEKKLISVFEYFAQPTLQTEALFSEISLNSQKVPTLIKEIYLPFEISRFIITQKYICVKSKSKTQIRDSDFEKVFYAENRGILNHRNNVGGEDKGFDTTEDLQLDCDIINDEMTSWRVINKKKTNSTNFRQTREYWSQKVNIITKRKSFIKCRTQFVDSISKNKRYQVCKPPLFLSQLGYIQNFYIWPFTSNDIQIGISFNHKENESYTQNALYQICSFKLTDSTIKQMFYYKFQGCSQKKNKVGPHLFIIVCENLTNEVQKIKVLILEVLPQQKINEDPNLNEAMNSFLDQFTQIKQQKSFQQSISSNVLLNQLLTESQKNQVQDKPTSIVESFALKNSNSFRKALYNDQTKVLWIDDSNDQTFKIQFLSSEDSTKHMSKKLSFVESVQKYKNQKYSTQLQGIISDMYPIYKRNAISLEIPIKGLNASKIGRSQAILEEEKSQIIEFDDKQLETIQGITQKPRLLNEVSTKAEFDIKSEQRNVISQKVANSLDLQQQQYSLSIKLNKLNTKAVLKDQYAQTDCESINQNPTERKTEDEKEKQNKQIENENGQNQQQKLLTLNVKNLQQVLKSLNFDKVESSLIRFSSLFVANVTKNVNKLRQSNTKAKEEIKQKIGNDIFELIKQVFQPMMGDALGDKISCEVVKARQFIDRVFNKNIQNFNLMLLQEKQKQQKVKKQILEEQIKSISVIKDATMKFLDVTKIREMQKIAYNEVMLQNVKQITNSLLMLESKMDVMAKQSQEMEKRIFQQIKQVKETFQQLIQLEKVESSISSCSSSCQESSSSDSEYESEEEDENISFMNRNFSFNFVPQETKRQYQENPSNYHSQRQSPQMTTFQNNNSGATLWGKGFDHDPFKYSHFQENNRPNPSSQHSSMNYYDARHYSPMNSNEPKPMNLHQSYGSCNDQTNYVSNLPYYTNSVHHPSQNTQSFHSTQPTFNVSSQQKSSQSKKGKVQKQKYKKEKKTKKRKQQNTQVADDQKQ